jgi:hypothetical protein
MADAETVHKARKNGERAGKYGERTNAEEVIDLLVASSDSKNAERRNANLLLEEMAAKPWWIMAGRHKGGFGGKGRLPDKTYHYTIRTYYCTYHLRVDANNHIFEITGTNENLDKIPKSQAPGTWPGVLGRGAGQKSGK